MKNKRVVIILSIALSLLFIPLFAMQFTNEVDWNLFDFISMGMILVCTGLVVELTFRKVKNFKNRLLLGSILFIAFLLLWAELAIGVFDTPFAGS